MGSSVAITHTTNGKRPRLPFDRLKNSILGKSYTLSIVFAGDYRMRNLNKKYRHATYIPNVLSFPLSKKQGEIFINLNRIHVEAKHYAFSERVYTAYLLIHGLLHLKGMAHSVTMEKKELELLQKFNFQ